VLSFFSSRPHMQAGVYPSPVVPGGGGGHNRFEGRGWGVPIRPMGPDPGVF
jgi:hypothetical protein